MLKATLVIQGGGTRGGFAAGVLDVFMENGLCFSNVYGTSAGALNGVNFLSGDQGRSHYVVTKLMADRRFVSVWRLLTRGELFNFDYLFRVVPKKKAPFNEKTFFESQTHFYAVSTCLNDGRAAYIEKTPDKARTYACLAASSSLPFYSRPVPIDGKLYLDGGQVAPIPFRKALDDGDEKIVIILTREYGFVQPGLTQKSIEKAQKVFAEYPEYIQAFIDAPEVYNQDMREIERLEKEGRLFVIRPSVAPNIGVAERKYEKLEALYQAGRSDAENALPALRKYLEIDE